MKNFKIAVHSFDIGVPYRSLVDFKNHLLGTITASLQTGADIVILPEHTAYASAKLPECRTQIEIARMMWTEVFPEVMKLSQTYDALICAGTAPNVHRDSGKIRNRALIAASGKSHESYKRCLTPWENNLEPGGQTLFFEWKNHKFANLICFDSEFPEVASELKRFGPHFIFVQAATVDAMGMNRVHRCCSARAVELGAVVAVSSLVGLDENNPFVVESIGKCAFYFPAQEIFKNQPTLESPTYTQGNQVLIHEVDLESVSKVKRPDSETKPFVKTLNAF